MQLRLLGPLALEDDAGRSLPVGGPKERALLALLATNANRVVPEGVVIHGLWGDEAPRTAGRTLQTYISRLRKALRADGGAGTMSIQSHPEGWSLVLPDHALDLLLVETRVADARSLAMRGEPGLRSRRSVFGDSRLSS